MYKLRELSRNDVKEINLWRSNKELIENLGAPFRYIDEEIDFKWFDNYLNNRSTTVRCTILDGNNQAIGLVSLTNINHLNQTAVFHIMIGSSEHRGKGVGYIATNEMLKHAFYDLNLNRVELTLLESNKAALNLYSKVGFEQEGIKRQAVYKRGEFINMISMSILKTEFEKR